MSYYIRVYEHMGQIYHQLWKAEESTIFRIDITNARGSGAFFDSTLGEEIIAAVERQCPSWFADGNPFHETVLGPGEYYPRIARPSDSHPNESPGRCPGLMEEANNIAVARGQLIALARTLNRICETVHPEGDMLGAYGHEIRNLLILACTEVESQWRGVLTANSCRGDFKRQHYVRLRDPMKLDEYAVSFPNFPWLSPFKPFLGWGKSEVKNTDGLTWYDAYNQVKHKREDAFRLATLNNAFNAISACFVMLVAQYGVHDGLRHNPELTSSFQLLAVPSWPLSEVYLFPYGEGPRKGYIPKPFPFQI